MVFRCSETSLFLEKGKMTGRRVTGYSLNSSRPAFSSVDDDDDLAGEFLSSSSAAYLAADRLPPDISSQYESEAEMRRHEVLQQMRKVEQRTLESSKRSIGILTETEQVGIDTATELVRQREQLKSTESKLDSINSSLKDSQKNINGIKSVFSSLKTWWSAPKNEDKKDEKDISPSKPSNEPKLPDVSSNQNLGAAFVKSQKSLDASVNHSKHPAMRLQGLEEEDDLDYNVNEWRSHSERVNQQLDSDLEIMSSGLSRLKGLAMGLGSEIEDHNVILERVTEKTDKSSFTIESQNQQIKKILKK